MRMLRRHRCFSWKNEEACVPSLLAIGRDPWERPVVLYPGISLEGVRLGFPV